MLGKLKISFNTGSIIIKANTASGKLSGKEIKKYPRNFFTIINLLAALAQNFLPIRS